MYEIAFITFAGNRYLYSGMTNDKWSEPILSNNIMDKELVTEQDVNHVISKIFSIYNVKQITITFEGA